MPTVLPFPFEQTLLQVVEFWDFFKDEDGLQYAVFAPKQISAFLVFYGYFYLIIKQIYTFTVIQDNGLTQQIFQICL